MKATHYCMQREHAPPGFWQWPVELVLIDGVELESKSPTRFFQTIDAYPRSWGRLSWRVQVNKIVAGQAGLPLFRSFYPGVEWNLNCPDYRWFLSAWFRWEQHPREPRCALPARIEENTVLFSIAPIDPEFNGILYLRSRVDARDRRDILKAVRSQNEQEPASDSGVIVLDDFIDLHEPT